MGPGAEDHTDPAQMGAVSLAWAIAGKRVSAVEAVSACFARRDQVDGVINAIPVGFEEAALIRAQEADAALRNDEVWGPLHGIPVVIKGNVDIAGQANTQGLKILSGNVASENSPVVDNLLRAGAIPIGYSNIPELSIRWHTECEAYGTTKNPWNPALTPGGSSGGAGAALITGQCSLAHGNDYGGSLRFPAQCAGVVTIRPTIGRIPQFNVTAPGVVGMTAQLMAVQGPMARRVEDVRIALHAMAVTDARDPSCVPGPMERLEHKRPLKIAVPDLGREDDVDEQVANGVLKAAGILEQHGCAVEIVKLPDIPTAHDLYCKLVVNEMRHDLAHLIQPFLQGPARQAFDNLLHNVPVVAPAEMMGLLASRAKLMREWSQFFGTWDLILGPVSTRTPFAVGDDAAGTEQHMEILRSL